MSYKLQKLIYLLVTLSFRDP